MKNLVQNRNNTNNVNVFSIFIGETIAEQIATWIIVVAIIVGLLLFIPIIVALSQVSGNFKTLVLNMYYKQTNFSPVSLEEKLKKK